MGARPLPEYNLEPLERRLLLAASPVSYGSSEYLPTDSQPVAVAVGDFNGDGNLDIVSANQADNTVSVLLGTGGGNFAPQTIWGVGNQPTSVAVGSLNHNGHDDIVATNLQDGTVSVFFGNGDGTFQPVIGIFCGTEPTGVALADLTGSGFLDIIVSDRASNTVCVIMNNGDGTFQNGVLYPVGNYPTGVAVADLNNDGFPDIITSNFYDNTVSVLINNGNGTFQPQKIYSVGHEPTSVAAADFTNNGCIDIVTTNEADNTISVLWGNGAGGFGPAVDWGTGPYPFSIATADLNNDGLTDIIVGDLNNTSAGIINVFLSNGDGSFTTEGFYAGSRPFGVAAGDVTGDGVDSLISADPVDNAVVFVPSTTTIVTGITVSNGSNPAGVLLNWNPVAGAASYQVFRSTVDNINTATKIAFGLTTTSYLDTTAVPGQVYFYWIRYRNPTLVGVFSGSVIGSAPVAAPTGVAVNATLAGIVQITWNPVFGAASYQVFSSTINDVTTATKIAFALTTTSYIDTTEVPGTTYFYWVRARNPGGVGAYSGSVISPLLAPTGVTATNGTLPDQVDLTWNPVAGAVSYQVFQSATNDITTATKIAFALTTTAYNDTSTIPGIAYYYWIRSRDPAGVGFFSTPATSGFAQLPAPTGIAATQGTDPNGVTLTWNAVTNAATYNVYSSTTNDFTTAVQIATGVATLSYEDTTAVGGQLVYYWVQAANTLGSGIVGGSVSGFAPLAAPTGIAATQGTDPNGVTLNWNAVTNAATYNVFSNAVDDFATATQIATGIATPTYEDTTAVGGQLVFYWVQAVNALSTGLVGGWVSGFAPLAAATGIAASTGIVGQVDLTWNPVTNAATYSVFSNIVNDFATATQLVTGLVSPAYNDMTAISGQTYFYWIQAVNPLGAGLAGGPVTGEAA